MKRYFLTIIVILTLSISVTIGVTASIAPVSTEQSKKKSSGNKKNNNTSSKKSSTQVKNQKKQTEEEIKKNQQRLQQNIDSVKKNMQKIDVLQLDIAQKSLQIDSIDNKIKLLQDSVELTELEINNLEVKREKLRSAYAKILRSMRRSRSQMSDLAFIFSAESFDQAIRRTIAIKQFSIWREKKAEEIKLANNELSVKQQVLNQLLAETEQSKQKVAEEKQLLLAQQKKVKEINDNLRKNQTALKNVIQQQQQQINELDREIERIIEAERKAAEEAARKKAEEEKRKKEQEKQKNNSKDKPSDSSRQKPSNSNSSGTGTEVDPVGKEFAQNKGYLRYPVDGRYTISKHFGVNPHPNSPTAKFDSPGIELITQPNAIVRCVFEGTVSAVVPTKTNNIVILVKHGNYMTVYANLSSADVKNGQQVKKDQSLGVVSNNGENGVLIFEIRKMSGSSSTKENPEIWLKK